MKVAVIGSRNIVVKNMEIYLPKETTEIVSGGARSVDRCAANLAKRNNLILTEFLPKYNIYGKAAPLKRNLEIINYSDYIIAFWDGHSKGTKFVIDNCRKMNKKFRVIMF